MKVRKLFWERNGYDWEAGGISCGYEIVSAVNELRVDGEVIARGPFYDLKDLANAHNEKIVRSWLTPDGAEDDCETDDDFPEA